MKKLFGDYTYTWWQMGIFKLALLAIGLIAGAYLASFVMEWMLVLIAIAVLSSGYIIGASLSGRNKRS
jgi:hypothetical protein